MHDSHLEIHKLVSRQRTRSIRATRAARSWRPCRHDIQKVPSASSLDLSDDARAALEQLPEAVQAELLAATTIRGPPEARDTAIDVSRPTAAPASTTALSTLEQAPATHKPRRLSAASFDAAYARYSTPTVLRTLLTHDEARGGVAIRLVRARWLLEHFQADDAAARLEHRQELERRHGDAPFVAGEMLQRVLAEMVGGEQHPAGESRLVRDCAGISPPLLLCQPEAS